MPGVVGVICLLLAAYALQVLPVNYAGLALIIVGIGLMTAEAFAPSFGALGLGGIAAFVFGAIMMFDSGIPGFGISLAFVIGLAIVAAAAIIWLVWIRTETAKARGGFLDAARLSAALEPQWKTSTARARSGSRASPGAAMSKVAIRKNQEVVVRDMHGLILEVEPVSEPDAGDAPVTNLRSQLIH